MTRYNVERGSVQPEYDAFYLAKGDFRRELKVVRKQIKKGNNTNKIWYDNYKNLSKDKRNDISDSYGDFSQILKERFGEDDYLDKLPSVGDWASAYDDTDKANELIDSFSVNGYGFINKDLKTAIQTDGFKVLTTNEFGGVKEAGDTTQDLLRKHLWDAKSGKPIVSRNVNDILKDSNNLLSQISTNAKNDLASLGIEELDSLTMNTSSNVIETMDATGKIGEDILAMGQDLISEPIEDTAIDLLEEGAEIAGSTALETGSDIVSGVTGFAKAVDTSEDPRTGEQKSSTEDRIAGAMDVAGAMGEYHNPTYFGAHMAVKGIDLLEELLT